MSFPVQNLIEGKGEPTYSSPQDPVTKALALMQQHDYSQLPVVNEAKKPLGMITYESILRAHQNFGIPVDDLSVSDAMTKAHTYRPEDDLFELLNRLQDTNAVLIVDGENTLTGIVTSYDSNEYFRRRAEDMMVVEDIETMVKDLILAAFSDRTGEVIQADLQQAVEDITSSGQGMLKQYKGAVHYYFHLLGHDGQRTDEDALEVSFSKLVPQQRTKSFDELTLYEYNQLLLHRDRWVFYERFFNLSRDALQRVLDSVRDTRNALAHHREITPEQRDQLRFCADWLERHPIGIPVEWPLQPVEAVRKQGALREAQARYETTAQRDGVIPSDEELSPSDSRYAPLAVWLSSQPSIVDRVQLQFSDIEDTIRGPLPPSARQHRSWWANDPIGHVQAKQWLDVGWRATQVNMTEERLAFTRIKEREAAYISFFSALQNNLNKDGAFPLKQLSPDGQSWHTLATLPQDGPQSLYFFGSFARGNRFRVELYIDTPDQHRNKQIFDYLQAASAGLEKQLGQELSWERLNERRASRIAVYHPGSITDDGATLDALRCWAAETMVRFYQTLAEPANRALTRATEMDD